MIPSPCQQLCVLDPASGHCIGCGRNAAEIAVWAQLGDEARRAIIDDLAPRLAEMRRARIARNGSRRSREGRALDDGGAQC